MMTALDFFILCADLAIDPELVQEDEHVSHLVRGGASLDELRSYLEENY